MANIIQTRVDARLIHGQASIWMQSNGCNLVILADDEAASNEMQQTLMDTTVPEGVSSRYFTLQKTIDLIHKAAASQIIYIVVRNLKNLKTLIDGGVPITNVNLGNAHQTSQTTHYSSHINLTKEEENIVLELASQRITFDTRIMPNIEKGQIDLVSAIKEK